MGIQFEDIPVLPIAKINDGVVAGFSPYYNFNYSHFSLGSYPTEEDPNNAALFYTLSHIAPGPWITWRDALSRLIGPGGRLPFRALLPSIVGAAPQTYIELRAFSFACGIRTSLGNSVPFDCQVVIRPFEPARRHQYHLCTFSSRGSAELQICSPNLAASKGYTFQTRGYIRSLGWFRQWQSLFNTGLTNTLFTVIDDIHYYEYCMISS